MFDKSLAAAVKFPFFVLLASLIVFVAGVHGYRTMPVDAFPDISPVMVPIFAESHGMAPEEMERLITWPIESVMNGLPGVTLVKSTSAFGMSVIYVYFTDKTDIFFARQLVSERLSSVSSELPQVDQPPTLGPISTGLGEVFMYYLVADAEKIDTEGKDLNTWLRELNDWVIKYRLQTVKGVTTVLSMGGHVLQYQIRLDPMKMQQYNLSPVDVVEAVRANNRNVGGQFLVIGSEELLVRGVGLIETLEAIRTIPLKVVDGTPVLMDDVAEVAYGNEVRRGVVSQNGDHEVVSGIVMKLHGENTSEVIKGLHKQIEQIKSTLPPGVDLVSYYDQADLVKSATSTVTNALLQGALLILIVLFIFLGNLRTTLMVMVSLPLCALIAILLLNWLEISANLMSLGGIAIAIGMLCDGAIVMVESILYGLKNRSENASVSRCVLRSAKEVARPIAFSAAIVIMVFLPLLTLEGVEGKMFSPMAFSISAAMIGSALVALFVLPALAVLFLANQKLEETSVVTRLKQVYAPLLQKVLTRRSLIPGVAVAMLIVALILLSQVGTEFIPPLEEGSIFIGMAMAPSISLEEATRKVQSAERLVLEFPEVNRTISRLGRPEAGSHPHPINYGELYLQLKPHPWSSGRTKDQLIEALEQKLEEIPGKQLVFTQPIQNAFDELISGVKTQLAIKVFGEDLQVLQQVAEQIHALVEDIPGLVDLSVEQSFGQPQIQVVPDRELCARYGVSVDHLLEIIELAVGGEVISYVYPGTRRFGIHLRYAEEYRNSVRAISDLLIKTSSDSLVPLSQVASVNEVTGPIQINRENNQRRWYVQGNIRGRDLGSVVAEIQRRLDDGLSLPVGYAIGYGGQFENQQRAMRKLSILVPIIIVAVLLMLWITFSSLRHALIIFVMVPMSVIGGVFGLYVMGEYLSVPASIGFIALFGMAMLDGLVMLSCFNQLRDEGKNLYDAVVEGSKTRLAPVLMTTLTTLLGLLPLLLATGKGSEVQRPLASVVVFGLLTSTILTLILIPSIYLLIEEKYS